MNRLRSNNDLYFIEEKSYLKALFLEVKDPRVSSVCKLWNTISMNFSLSKEIIDSYKMESCMNIFTKNIPIWILDRDAKKAIREIFQGVSQIARKAGIYEECKDLAPLELVSIMKRVEGSALITLFTRLSEQIPEAKNLLGALENTSLMAAASSIRAWMGKNPKLLNEIITLDLDSCHLCALPMEIFYLEELKELKLDNNHLKVLPMAIGSLEKLRVLTLSNNQLTELPPFIGELTRLKVLDLGYNKLTELPQDIGRLTELTDLYLWHNDLSALPLKISLLTCLEVLFLSHNSLTKLPWGFYRLTSLQELYLSHNKFKTLPESLFSILSLKELWLNDNELESISENLNNIEGLRTLALHNNRLKKRPDVQLKRLSLQNNNF